MAVLPFEDGSFVVGWFVGVVGVVDGMKSGTELYLSSTTLPVFTSCYSAAS